MGMMSYVDDDEKRQYLQTDRTSNMYLHYLGQ